MQLGQRLVVEFKREVYRQALAELHRFLNSDRRRVKSASAEP